MLLTQVHDVALHSHITCLWGDHNLRLLLVWAPGCHFRPLCVLGFIMGGTAQLQIHKNGCMCCKLIDLWLCSVEAVQRRLASLIGTPVSEQILIVNGTPLDPRQTLGIYKLPVRPAISLYILLSAQPIASTASRLDL
jgi:hypothetical protein